MGLNRHRDHVLILPEDDANRDIAIGFASEIPLDKQSALKILPVAGGWRHAVDLVLTTYQRALVQYPYCNLILLIDMDKQEARRKMIMSEVAVHIQSRVFVIGCWGEAEDINSSRERFGRGLARDCIEDQLQTWNHPQFLHNDAERQRLADALRKVFF